MNRFLDVRELPCPQPVVEVKLLLKQMKANEILTILCKDEMTLVDLKAFCSMLGYQLFDIIKYPNYIELKISL